MPKITKLTASSWKWEGVKADSAPPQKLSPIEAIPGHQGSGQITTAAGIYARDMLLPAPLKSQRHCCYVTGTIKPGSFSEI